VAKLAPVTTDTVQDMNQGPGAGELRAALVKQIISRQQLLGQKLPEAVVAALQVVPRHLFIPGAALDRAYADESVITKTDDRGVNISAVSAPTSIAGMLGQLDARPGHRVLEIGSGGYNAALLREIVGPDGDVTTIDIDPEVTDRARSCLDEAGYRDVRTMSGDGEFGADGHWPFDRIIVTAGAWDIPPAWREQLASGGRLVVPLRTRGLTRSWALEHAGGHLVGRSPMMCGFVPMQGAGGHRGRSIPLHEAGVSLWTDEELPAGSTAFPGVLAQPRAESWTGVTIGKQASFDDQDLWLATLPDFAILTAEQAAVDQGLVTPSWRIFTPALTSGGSLAYRARPRPADAGQTMYEFGAYGHGPDAETLADRLARQIRHWDTSHRGGAGPALTVHPSGTPDADLPDGFVLEKRHSRIVISWP